MARVGFCMLLAATALFEIGDRTDARCTGYATVAPIALCAILASLLVKLVRVYLIFTQKELQVTRIGDGRLAIGFAGFVLVGVVLAIVWRFVLPNGVATEKVTITSSLALRGVVMTECAYGPAWIWALWALLLLGMVLVNLRYIFGLRKVPAQFSEPATLFWIAILMLLLSLISIAGLLFASSDLQRSIWKVLLVLVCSVLIALIYVGPKLLAAFYKLDSSTTQAGTFFGGTHAGSKLSSNTQPGGQPLTVQYPRRVSHNSGENPNAVVHVTSTISTHGGGAHGEAKTPATGSAKPVTTPSHNRSQQHQLQAQQSGGGSPNGEKPERLFHAAPRSPSALT